MGVEQRREWAMDTKLTPDRDAPPMVGSKEACEVSRSRIQIWGCCDPEHRLHTVQAQSSGSTVTATTIPTSFPCN